MARSRLRFWGVGGLVVASLVLWRTQTEAIQLDKDGDIKLGVRTYVNARVGTEDTHNGLEPGSGNPNASEGTKLAEGTFPRSEAGHLRQNRAFIEAELSHDVSRLVKDGTGPFALLNDLPFKVKHLAYHFTFRGEGEGLYDWGPREYSTASDFQKVKLANPPIPFVKDESGTLPGQEFVPVEKTRHSLRKVGTDRERLFQAYIEGDVGDLFWRVGRQILSWGETDGFQLLDHINPLDSSFGGFLISIDERRMPLDMVLANYYIGDFGPISEMHLEGYAAFDKSVGFVPGTPAGSPWGLPGGSAPSNASTSFTHQPALTVNNARGGFQLKFNAFDATFGLAHYYTYFDVPAVQVVIHDYNAPKGSLKGILTGWDDGGVCPDPADRTQPAQPLSLHCGTSVRAFETAPKVQVSGVSTTFALPQIYSIVRSEVAYFKDEPAFTQGQLDPFLFNNTCLNSSDKTKPCDSFKPTPGFPWHTTGGRRLRDSFNAVVGLDANQWIRFLNPNQTFLISTQFFYKHIFLAAPAGPIYLPPDKAGNIKPNPDREVLPVQAAGAYSPLLFGSRLSGLGPVFITQPQDQYLQTLFIGTSYRSGMISPGFLVFYDWGGGLVYQPSITFSRDPFRFIMDYSVIDAHTYKGGSGVSLLKDRDNVQFRVEYVI